MEEVKKAAQVGLPSDERRRRQSGVKGRHGQKSTRADSRVKRGRAARLCRSPFLQELQTSEVSA